MVTARHFEELGCDFDIVQAIFDDLNTAFACIVFCPGVRVQAVALVAGVTGSCEMQVRMHTALRGNTSRQLTADGLVVLCAKPHETSHE